MFLAMTDWLQINLCQRNTHTHSNTHIPLLFEETEEPTRHGKLMNQDLAENGSPEK